MKAMVMGMVMLAGGVVRSRGTPLDAAVSRAPADGGAMSTTAAALSGGGATASLERAPVRDTQEVEVEVDGGEPASTPPAAGEWEVACQLKNGASMMFDRRSVRELGAVTLVRWAAPSDPRARDQIFTALVSCREKTIEAAWPGKRSETRAGTCGRRLVEAVCQKQPRAK